MSFLRKRDDDDDDDEYCYHGLTYWSCSRRSEIIKWSILLTLLLLLTTFFLASYLHARRRLAANLPPLAYHRWMVRRRLEPSANLDTRPAGAVLATYVVNERGEYVLQPLSSVPPAYHHPVQDPLPVYPGPPAGSKVDPNQDGYLGAQATGTTTSGYTSGEGSSYGGAAPPPPAPVAAGAPPGYFPAPQPQGPSDGRGPSHPVYTQ
ncbi:hypothetical protein BJ508DRAFT_414775 [Ascobolus immersus RN42]|uniref:Uncharacterized protein n=1 Tax=Ascobolus immersus RN42 TaxID=1160509 RepID=A0A3N4I778_ASCIM|nr:hypothetical protein BJ508DRAFT_414775 [Ascobolus immersus RN42]